MSLSKLFKKDLETALQRIRETRGDIKVKVLIARKDFVILTDVIKKWKL